MSNKLFINYKTKEKQNMKVIERVTEIFCFFDNKRQVSTYFANEM